MNRDEGPYRAVLLDIDGTVCEYERDGTDILPVAFERAGVEPFFTDAEYIARYPEFADESENVVDLRERCFAALAEEAERDPDVGREVARAYAAERDHSRVRFTDGAERAVEILAERHPLAAVTNGDPTMQTTKLEALGIADRFERVVHAGYETPAKPDPTPFYEALSAIEADPVGTIHVGNSLSDDVAGAKNAGLAAAWVGNGSRGGDGPARSKTDLDPRPDHVLETLGDLPALLE
jgi:FMN phosphatase YigB (HAD superfamily)